MRSKLSAKPRLVFDTNILVSTHINAKGHSAQLYQLFKTASISLYTSPYQIQELERVLHYDRIKQKFHLLDAWIEEIVATFTENAQVVYPQKVPSVIKSDPDDNHILAIAHTAQADAILSGDNHLLELMQFEGIPIIRAADFLKKLKRQSLQLAAFD